MKLTSVIYSLIETEKTEGLKASQNVYALKVTNKASKDAIEKSLKDAFKVDCVWVKTLIMPGKKRRLSKTARFVTTASWKKALVKLKTGQKLEL